MLERRWYSLVPPPPLLAVVLTAALAGLGVWRLSPLAGCPDCRPDGTDATAHPTAAYLLDEPTNDSDPYEFEAAADPRDESTLIDLRNFTFLMTGPVCNASEPPLYIALIHTAPDHRQQRSAIRETWGRRAPLAFLVGETNDLLVQEELKEESSRYQDVVQGNFIDSYRNLTYKHVMGLKWAVHHCPAAKYVVKLDDDVFVNTPQLEEFLSPRSARHLVLCNVQVRGMVKRSYRSKWRVTMSEYRGRFYPNYCAGWVVVYSPDAVVRLYREAQRSQYFWVDDVHVTGTLVERINYTHTSAEPLSKSEATVEQWLERREVPPQEEEFLFAMIPSESFRPLWSLLRREGTSESIPSSHPWTIR